MCEVQKYLLFIWLSEVSLKCGNTTQKYKNHVGIFRKTKKTMVYYDQGTPATNTSDAYMKYLMYICIADNQLTTLCATLPTENKNKKTATTVVAKYEHNCQN